jgi:hypothetical protein
MINQWVKEFKFLLLVGGLPCLGFVLGIILSFIIYPEDVEGASTTLMITAGTGVFLGLFLLVNRMAQRL